MKFEKKIGLIFLLVLFFSVIAIAQEAQSQNSNTDSGNENVESLNEEEKNQVREGTLDTQETVDAIDKVFKSTEQDTESAKSIFDGIRDNEKYDNQKIKDIWGELRGKQDSAKNFLSQYTNPSEDFSNDDKILNFGDEFDFEKSELSKNEDGDLIFKKEGLQELNLDSIKKSFEEKVGQKSSVNFRGKDHSGIENKFTDVEVDEDGIKWNFEKGSSITNEGDKGNFDLENLKFTLPTGKDGENKEYNIEQIGGENKINKEGHLELSSDLKSSEDLKDFRGKFMILKDSEENEYSMYAINENNNYNLKETVIKPDQEIVSNGFVRPKEGQVEFFSSKDTMVRIGGEKPSSENENFMWVGKDSEGKYEMALKNSEGSGKMYVNQYSDLKSLEALNENGDEIIVKDGHKFLSFNDGKLKVRNVDDKNGPFGYNIDKIVSQDGNQFKISDYQLSDVDNVVTLNQGSVDASSDAIGRIMPSGTGTPSGIKSPTETRRDIESSSVRIVVTDPNGKSYGTGTIIDQKENGDALVLTVAHTFGEYKPGDEIKIELLGDYEGKAAIGRLVSKNPYTDVALVAINSQEQLEVANLAPRDYNYQANSKVIHSGCAYGGPCEVRDSYITVVDKYAGTPNVEVYGYVEQGRSGGGLFNNDGDLIGVVFATNNEEPEGLYNRLQPVYDELDRNNIVIQLIISFFY